MSVYRCFESIASNGTFHALRSLDHTIDLDSGLGRPEINHFNTVDDRNRWVAYKLACFITFLASAKNLEHLWLRCSLIVPEHRRVP